MSVCFWPSAVSDMSACSERLACSVSIVCFEFRGLSPLLVVVRPRDVARWEASFLHLFVDVTLAISQNRRWNECIMSTVTVVAVALKER